MGPHNHPEITLTGIAMHHALDAWERGDLATLRAIFLADAGKLAAAGADFFVLPDNTAHIALEAPGEAFPIPCLHIGEVVADAGGARRPLARSRILGTEWTMTGPVYPGAARRRGLDWEMPGRSRPRRDPPHHLRRALPRRGQGRVARRLCRDHRAARRARLRRRRPGLHRNPAAGRPPTSRRCRSSIRPACSPAPRSRSRSANGRCRLARRPAQLNSPLERDRGAEQARLRIGQQPHRRALHPRAVAALGGEARLEGGAAQQTTRCGWRGRR